MSNSSAPRSSTGHRSVLRFALAALGTSAVVAFGAHAALAGMHGPSGGIHGVAGQCGPRSHGDFRPGWGPDRMLSDIGVTADQRAKLRTLRQTRWDKMRPLRDQMQQLRQERMKLLAQPQIDRGALEALRVKGENLADQMSRQMTESQYDMAQILTPEQRAKLYDRMSRRADWRNHDGGPGPMMR